MQIAEIYRTYSITSLLAQHQMRAAAVGSFIADHWRGTALDKTAIIQTLLIHDMGNMIKFNFDYTWMFSQDELEHLPELQKRQREMRAKYNADEHVATYAIAKEIGVSDAVYHLLTHMGSSKLQATLESDNWHLKIVSYADLRCAPSTVVSVEERFADIMARYEDGEHALSDIEQTKKKRELCLQLERQIQQFCTIGLMTIREDIIAPIMKSMQTFLLF